MNIPEWKRVMTNSKFKSNLKTFLTKTVHIMLKEDKVVIVSCGLDDTALKVV